MRSIRRHLLVAGALALFVAAPLAAEYIVILKDGSRIVADAKYRVEGSRAIITLPNGTTTFLEASEIDRAATERANRAGFGGATVLEDGTVRRTEPADVPPDQARRRELNDLINRRGTGATRRLEPQRRRQPGDSGRAGRTTAGYLDLTTLPRRAHGDLELVAELHRLFRGQGLDSVELYQGSTRSRPLAEIATNSEASVFRALEIAATAVVALEESRPDDVEALELLLSTPSGQRAGQFVLTPELARELVEDRVEVSRFFIENVQF